MKPERKSRNLLGVTRSKAKMIEFGVPEKYQDINFSLHPDKLFTISIGMLGDVAAAINRGDPDVVPLAELKANLLFSAHFFDSYLESKLNKTLDPYTTLLASACYYLCDLPGSSAVLAKRTNGEFPDLGGAGLEVLLFWLLQADLGKPFDEGSEPFEEFITGISYWIHQFFENGEGEEKLFNLGVELRNAVYEYGTPRQLLFGDIIAAVLKKKIENSVWKALPLYSGLPRDIWFNALQKDSFIKELWPAQHLLGQKDILKGKSAIVQMPTSAGKTKAIELILRSAILAGRASLAIIIAPFRALCHEIRDNLLEVFHNERVMVDELSDATQPDFEIAELTRHPQILVVTPEKLVYVLRHAPELAAHVGLLVFDEGHQFDSGSRGITYELLLTSLCSLIPDSAQKVLISAVINNAEDIGKWLNGDANVVEGKDLIPTLKLVGFASWLDQLGRIEYVDSRDPRRSEFFVPRVIEKFRLRRKRRESTDHFFPKKDDVTAIALYLGLKLIPNGSTAVFCGTKSIAASFCKKAVDIIERGIPMELPSNFSDAREVKRLKRLHDENLGTDSPASKSAAYGIFFHHGNTPHGIRLAVEYALRNNFVRFVVCTSTLAQGVNLPIRYLIVANLYQGKESLKVRDFHNLIGRAGRAGMYTEGSILFANPGIFDKRMTRDGKWRWNQVKRLLEPNNSEPCASNLLSIFDPITLDYGSSPMKGVDFAKAYINNPDDISRQSTEQIALRIDLICAVESFLLSHCNKSGTGFSETDAASLAERTLAFSLADDPTKAQIRELFQLLARNISAKIGDPARCNLYGRTLYGIHDASLVERWVEANAENLFSIDDEADLFDIFWPLISRHIKVEVSSRFDKPEVLKEIADGWINGKSFSDLLKIIWARNARMKWGKRLRDFNIEYVVNVCEGTLAYDGALVIGAACEFLEHIGQERADVLINHLQLFQKRLKYGLPNVTTIVLYELGFSDRVIAQKLAVSLHLTATRKQDLVRALKANRNDAQAILEKYPTYYQKRLDGFSINEL